MAAMLSLLVLFAAISQCEAQFYGDGDGDSPSPTPPPHGPPHECIGEGMETPHAAWVQIAASSGSAMLVSYETGVTRDFTVSNANTWASHAGSKAGIGFIIGFSGSGHSGASVAESYDGYFSATSSTTHSYSLQRGGVVWQFQFIVKDSCGTSVVKGSDLAETIGAWAAPCCLPGLFKNLAYANGDCHAGPVIGKVCNRNPTTTVAPWWPPSANDEFSGMQESQVIHFLGDGHKHKHKQNYTCAVSPLPVKAVEGQWRALGSSTAGRSVTITTSVTHSYISGDNNYWGGGVSSGMSVGFSFCGVRVSAGSSSGSSNSMANTFSADFSSLKSPTSSTFNFGDGMVWQWEFQVEDQCGTSIVKTQFVGSTVGVFEKPCCLPGFSENFEKLHGPCHGSTARDPSCPNFTFDNKHRNGTTIIV